MPTSISATASSAAAERQRLSRLQKRRKRVLALAAAALLVLLAGVQSVDWWRGAWHEGVEILGLLAIGVAILGRTWCTLYIGGRKAGEVVATGPYSVSRNPLYLFSFIGAFGVGAQTGSLVAALMVTAAVVAVFLPVVAGEERSLAALFGPAYQDYCRRVPRFGPALSRWRDMETVTVRPVLLWQTLRDGLVFFLVVPVFELIDVLQAKGVLVPFVVLP